MLNLYGKSGDGANIFIIRCGLLLSHIGEGGRLNSLPTLREESSPSRIDGPLLCMETRSLETLIFAREAV